MEVTTKIQNTLIKSLMLINYIHLFHLYIAFSLLWRLKGLYVGLTWTFDLFFISLFPSLVQLCVYLFDYKVTCNLFLCPSFLIYFTVRTLIIYTEVNYINRFLNTVYSIVLLKVGAMWYNTCLEFFIDS